VRHRQRANRRTGSGKIGSYLFSKHRIFTTPIVHEEFTGLRITPNLYTTLPELDRFCEVMASIAAQSVCRRSGTHAAGVLFQFPV
jgi:hypothetical protein